MHRYRTHTCGQLTKAEVGDQVRLSGWLHNRRDLGGLLFADLRDHYGVVQLVIRPGSLVFEQLARVPKETVIRVDGLVLARRAANNSVKCCGRSVLGLRRTVESLPGSTA